MRRLIDPDSDHDYLLDGRYWIESAQSVQRTGKWIYQDDDLFDNWKCDKCEGLITDWGRDALPKFCPNCGARMSGGEQ